MNTNNASKLPFILAGSAVGGAVGYLVMTNSGRKFFNSVRNMDSDGLRHQLEGARERVERAGNTVTDRVHDVLDRAKQSIEAGRLAYEDSGTQLRSRLTRLQGKSGQVAESVHQTVDGVNKTVSTFEASVLEPFYELGSLVKGVDRGVKRFFQRELPAVVEPSMNEGSTYGEHFG